METAPSAAPVKSTTGRDRPTSPPDWLRRSIQLTAAVAPDLAAAWANRLFFTPRHARVRPEEKAALATGERLEVELDDLRLQGWVFGQANAGTPVLLVHGWGGHSGQMTALGSALVSAGLRVMAVDMPAHGESQGTRSSLVHFGRAIEATVRVVGPLRGLVAHSFGCAGATFALSRGLPAARCVFVAPPIDFQVYWDQFRHALGISPSVWAKVVAVSEAELHVRWPDIVPRALAPNLKVPLRIFHDEDDREIPLAAGVALASCWPGAQLTATKGLGHFRILRDAGIAGQVVGFL